MLLALVCKIAARRAVLHDNLGRFFVWLAGMGVRASMAQLATTARLEHVSDWSILALGGSTKGFRSLAL